MYHKANYDVIAASGEVVGNHLTGSGAVAWTTPAQCIAQAVAHGYVPGVTVRYIQGTSGKCYYYAAGSQSGQMGFTNAYRLDLQAATHTLR